MRFLVSIRSWIINILLAATAAFFGYQAVEVWYIGDAPEVSTTVQKKPKSRANRTVFYRRNTGIATYDVIASKNLFSSDREELLPAKSKKTSKKVQTRPLDSRFALFGVVINGDQKKALVSNLGKKNAKEKDYIWVKVGDQIGTMEVSAIQSEQITIIWQGSSYSVRVADRNHPKKRPVTRKRTKRTDTNTKDLTEPELEPELEPEPDKTSAEGADNSS